MKDEKLSTNLETLNRLRKINLVNQEEYSYAKQILERKTAET
jgi:hypothetical protein